ncbi:hypothetical protein Tsubulata_046332 [Turnera subulata]|uniref:Uncharacterized protein n=1 Tax=Turnera subulata TaxID=218843 RepID=A0A9Q0GD82_9ROSI|nr:hypothetical protein Tsubulata_046332 [Turnera subulata]
MNGIIHPCFHPDHDDTNVSLLQYSSLFLSFPCFALFFFFFWRAKTFFLSCFKYVFVACVW